MVAVSNPEFVLLMLSAYASGQAALPVGLVTVWGIP